MSAKGTRDPGARRRWSKPTPQQWQVIRVVNQQPGLSMVEVATVLNVRKTRGAAIWVTIRRAIRRGFITAKCGKKAKSYALYPVPDWSTPP